MGQEGAFVHVGFFAMHTYVAQVRNGHIKRITDSEIQSLVLEIVGTNVRCVQAVVV
jgi:hypothetical protein